MKNAYRLLSLWLLIPLLFGCIHPGMSTCTSSCTDDNITTAMLVKIDSDRCMSDQFIHVTTYERTITMTGRVTNPTQKRIASEMAWSVPGVRDVVNKLKVYPLDQPDY